MFCIFCEAWSAEVFTEFRTLPTLWSTPVATSAFPACLVISSSWLCSISFSFSCFLRSVISLTSAVNVGIPFWSNAEMIISMGTSWCLFLMMISLPSLSDFPCEEFR